MCDHGHSHGSHDHGKAGLLGEELGFQYSLYQKIDLENVSCLNEEIEGSGKSVFKAWENRKNKETFVVSDADEELLFNIPFTGNIKLKGKHTVRNLHFLSKNSTLISQENCRFFWGEKLVKMLRFWTF